MSLYLVTKACHNLEQWMWSQKQKLQPTRSLPSIVKARLEKAGVQTGKLTNPTLHQDLHRHGSLLYSVMSKTFLLSPAVPLREK